jgi:hypothetical protein
LSPNELENPFYDFDEIFSSRVAEADEFYDEIQNDV